MAGIKRAPQVDNENIMWRALDIPKSEWIEMYFDLYRQVMGEGIDGEEIMQDAEKRRQILFNKSPKKRNTDRPAFWWESKNHTTDCNCPVCAPTCQDDYEYATKTGIYAEDKEQSDGTAR